MTLGGVQNPPRLRASRTGAVFDSLATCTPRRSVDRAEPATCISVTARRRPAGRKAFDQFRNLVTSVVAGGSGGRAPPAPSLFRPPQHGPAPPAPLASPSPPPAA